MSKKILIDDEEEANLRLLTQRLVPFGYDVEHASYYLIIMMPVMDGYEACGIL